MLGKYRFGLFEFDNATCELRRERERVHLEAQPAQVLGLLLARAGEVVTREELHRAVWGSETFVDFDRGLNYCIAQIRAGLQDSAQSPRFVRTLPKRGYQFIAPITTLAALPPECAVLEPSINKRFKARHIYWTAGIAAVALLLAASYILSSRCATAAAEFKIAVIRFDNETANPALDGFADGLTESLVADLTTAGVGRFGVIGNANIPARRRPQVSGTLH